VKSGKTQKQGCRFYVAFTQFLLAGRYRCSGINAIHTCHRDPLTWDRYSQYRNQNPQLRQEAISLMESGSKAGVAALHLNKTFQTRIRSHDINRILQTERENSRSLSDAGLQDSEVRQLLTAIDECGDQYRVKFKDGTQIMECIMYWDPTDICMAQRFSQIIQVDSTFKDNKWRYPLLEISATTNEMNTFIIAQALVPSESYASMLWVLERVTCLTIWPMCV
jgi:Zinc finger SWIM domain-containing protein 1/3, RNaseH-like domain